MSVKIPSQYCGHDFSNATHRSLPSNLVLNTWKPVKIMRQLIECISAAQKKRKKRVEQNKSEFKKVPEAEMKIQSQKVFIVSEWRA